MEEIPIATADSTMDTKMGNMMKAIEAWTFQMSKANERVCGGYQTARAYTIQADHWSLHTLTGPNYQPHQRQELGHSIYCNEQGHICTICPNVPTDQDDGIVHCNDRGRITRGLKWENGGEISGYRPERRFLSMQEYAREVARQGQQERGVATTAVPPPPQPQRIARSHLFQGASSPGNLYA